MTALTQTHPTLAQTLWQSENTMVRNVLLAIAGSIALWVSAKIQVPFYPVPMTMQTFMVLVIGMAFGWRLGAATVLLCKKPLTIGNANNGGDGDMDNDKCKHGAQQHTQVTTYIQNICAEVKNHNILHNRIIKLSI